MAYMMYETRNMRKEIAESMGMTEKEFIEYAKEKFENDPATIKIKNADICITGYVGEKTLIRLNKPISFFSELKGKKLKIYDSGEFSITENLKQKLFSNKNYNIVTDF